jgi:hypothetical protein
MAGEILKMSSAAKLTASVRRIRGAWASMGPELEKANQSSINWLNDRGLAHLDESVVAHGRPQRPEGVLRNVFINDLASSHTRRGFRWGVSQKLNSSPAGMYWRGVEHGSTVFVGRITRVIWITRGGGVVPPMPTPGPIDARMPNDWNGALNGRGWGVKIHTPITGYHFMATAADEFKSEDVYRGELRKASAAWRRVLAASAKSGTSPRQVRG